MRREKAKVVEAPVQAKPIVRQHPSTGLAKAIISWLDKRTSPPSVVIKQAIYLAHTDVHDERPIDFVREFELSKFNIDSRQIVQIMNKLNEPNLNRVEYLASILKMVWKDKKKPVEKNHKPVKKTVRKHTSHA